MKSHVTICRCPICKESTNELLLDRKLRPQFEMYTTTPNPCDKCKKKYLSKGVLLINPKTCGLVVLKTSAFKRIFDVEVPKQHIAYVDQEVLDRLQK